MDWIDVQIKFHSPDHVWIVTLGGSWGLLGTGGEGGGREEGGRGGWKKEGGR